MPEFCDLSEVGGTLFDRRPGVSLRSTPGYCLASLQLALVGTKTSPPLAERAGESLTYRRETDPRVNTLIIEASPALDIGSLQDLPEPWLLRRLSQHHS